MANTHTTNHRPLFVVVVRVDHDCDGTFEDFHRVPVTIPEANSLVGDYSGRAARELLERFVREDRITSYGMDCAYVINADKWREIARGLTAWGHSYWRKEGYASQRNFRDYDPR